MGINRIDLKTYYNNTQIIITKLDVIQKLPLVLIELLKEVKDKKPAEVIKRVTNFSNDVLKISEEMKCKTEAELVLGEMWIPDFIIAASNKGVLDKAVPSIINAIELAIQSDDWDTLNQTLKAQLTIDGRQNTLDNIVKDACDQVEVEDAANAVNNNNNILGDDKMNIANNNNGTKPEADEVVSGQNGETVNVNKTSKTDEEILEESLNIAKEGIGKQIESIIDTANEEMTETLERAKEAAEEIKETIKEEATKNLKDKEDSKKDYDWKDVAICAAGAVVVAGAAYVAYDYLFGDKVDVVVFNDSSKDFIGGVL